MTVPGTASTRTDPLSDWAASGVMVLTGRADGPPLVPPGSAATVAKRLGETISTATAGTGHPVLVDGAALLAERAAFTRRGRRGAVSVGGGCRLLRSSDGWVAVSAPRSEDRLLLGALVGHDLPDHFWPTVSRWMEKHSGRELAELAELLGLAAAPVTRPLPVAPQPAWPTRSVEGLLVVDFSALWAGPLCAHLLGLAGARVIKVETVARPDGARLGHADFYRLLHAGHQAFVGDPDDARGMAALNRLVGAADIVIEASRPRALRQWGIEAAQAVAGGTTWLSITAGGRASHRVGFGDDVAAGAGLVALATDGTPLFCGDAIADPLTGLTAAVLAMSVPAEGAARLWDISMTEVVASTLAGPVVEGSAPAASRAEGGWVLDTPSGVVSVTSPRRRPVRGRAPRLGGNTADVLQDLGLDTS